MKLFTIAQSVSVWMMAFATCMGAEPLMTNSTSFRIPFTLESTPGPSASGYAVLYGARDGGPMQQIKRVPVSEREFQFSAPSDGTWQFAIRMTDSAGRPSESAGPLTPELEVVVDTVAPGLNLSLSDAGQGSVHVTWESKDDFVLGSLNLQYAEGNDGRWKSLSVPLAASGDTRIQSRPGTSVAVRAQVTDRAGNTGSVTREVILASAPAAPAIPPQPADSQQWNGIPGAAPAIGTPVGPSPFPQLPASNAQPAPQVPGYGAFPQASAVPQAPAPHPMMPSGSPGIPQQQPALQATASRTTPMTQPWQMTGQQSVISGPAGAAVGQPVSQLVSETIFNVAYAVEDVGPSGVSSVELFVTEDNGQRWFRYGNDTDLQSPMQVDVQGEGTFGFAIRVRNGVGFIDPPPQPGDQPEIIVTVDRTAPSVEMQMPQVHLDGSAAVRVAWNVLEGQSTDVRLEWATAPSGPWVPVFDWQPDQGGYSWPLSANMPQSMYFRLLSRDAAGNIGSAQTAQPVLIDLKRPKARMLGVQSAAQNIGY